MLRKKRASVFQQGKEICSGPVYSALFSTTGTVLQDPWMPTWQRVLYITQVMWSPQGKSSPDHPGLCSRAVSSDVLRGASQCHITVFSSQSLLQRRCGGERKLNRSYSWHHHPSRAIGRRPAALARRQQQRGSARAPSTGRLPSLDPKLGLSPLDCRGRGGGAKAALSQSRKKGRPWAFPVVQLKQAKTSLHLHSLRVSADWGPKFSHFQCTARREVLEEKPAAALLLTALSALA